ncbi:hypothetical protein N801_00925 [Knoellia aerolata DSM 18566]|uniref:Uncharacterized protein n=1 Tax=Knoellia aerolata DSM 18566 TaxID=1385519 RepID=A0A0A0JJR0_9MICO|nr:hypothetical protein N801_00925 [Knoellia aerolata DSM 18566]
MNSTRQPPSLSVTVWLVAMTPATRHDHWRTGPSACHPSTRNGRAGPTLVHTVPVAPAWIRTPPPSTAARRTVGPHRGHWSTRTSRSHAISAGASTSMPRVRSGGEGVIGHHCATACLGCQA